MRMKANIWGSIIGTLSNQSDLQTALNGKYSTSNPSNYISGITSLMVTNALGFTPYNTTNPSGYITASTSDALTNKTGNISMWTNNSGYLTTIAGIAAGGDLSGTYVNPTVVAIQGKAVTLVTGFLKYTGSAFAFDSTVLSKGADYATTKGFNQTLSLDF